VGIQKMLKGKGCGGKGWKDPMDGKGTLRTAPYRKFKREREGSNDIVRGR